MPKAISSRRKPFMLTDVHLGGHREQLDIYGMVYKPEMVTVPPSGAILAYPAARSQGKCLHLPGAPIL